MMKKASKKSSKNRWILRSKIEKNRCKHALKKQAFFHIDFSLIFPRLGLHFGGSWRAFGDHFAVQNGVQKRKINFFDKIAIFNGFGEGLGRVLGGFWEGFGWGLGHFGRNLRDLGAFGALLELFARFCTYFYIFLAFLHIFDQSSQAKPCFTFSSLRLHASTALKHFRSSRSLLRQVLHRGVRAACAFQRRPIRRRQAPWFSHMCS